VLFAEFAGEPTPHDERRSMHPDRLRLQHPAPEDGRAFLDWAETLFADARAAAIADGYPAPGTAAAPPSEPDPAPPLPDDIWDDVAQSRARDRAARPPAADDPVNDRLAPYRGIGPLYFPHIDD
jgi:hypothetical protein